MGATLLDVDPAIGGYRYFLTAGAPTTGEDPEGRLISAALRIVHGATDYALRAGVTSGRVFAGFVGATYRQTYTVMGDPTNLAARLASRADPGTVLVSRAALERTARPFEAEDGGTISVKGKTQQIPVAVVTGHGGATTLSEQLTPFVGRHDEKERLRQLVTDAAAEVGGVLTIVGARRRRQDPPARARAGRDAAPVAACLRRSVRGRHPVPGDPDSPAAPPADTALVARARGRRASGTGRRRPLPAASPRGSPCSLRRSAPKPSRRPRPMPSTTASARNAPRRSSRTSSSGLTTGPGCLVLDDAQWVDPASAAVLTELIERDTRHAVIIVRRPEPGGLGPLGEELRLPGSTTSTSATSSRR